MVTKMPGADAHAALAQAAANGSGEGPVWSGRLIGELIIREVRDAIRIPTLDFKRAWEGAGLPEAWLSQARGPVDAFNRATPKEQKQGAYSFMPYNGPARVERMQRAAVLVRSEDAAERVGKEHLELGYVMLDAGDAIRFEYGPDLLRYPDLETQAESFVEKIRRDYHGFLGAYDGKACGRMIARALEHSASLTYHAGVYVLPLRAKPVVDALAEVFEVLDRYVPADSAKNVLYRIPYPDTAGTRAQVRDVLREHVRAECAAILEETRDFVAKGGSMSTSEGGKPVRGERHKGQTLLGKLATVQATVKAYQEQLREAQTEAQILLDAQRSAIRGLLGVAKPVTPSGDEIDIFA